MLRVKAIGPCSFPGFCTLLRGELCNVPDGLRESAERLRKMGRLEFVETPVVAEPSGNDAPADVKASSAAPPALTPEEQAEADELARLQAEIDALDGKIPPAETSAATLNAQLAKPTGRPPRPCKFCGKTWAEHAQGKPAEGFDSAKDCGGLKKLYKPADKVEGAPAPAGGA